MERFDHYSKTVYCACVQYITYSVWRKEATAQTTPIFNKFSSLLFSAVTSSTPVIFSQIAPKLMRILHDKNEKNGSSCFGETCLALILRSDRYSVPHLPSPISRHASLFVRHSFLGSTLVPCPQSSDPPVSRCPSLVTHLSSFITRFSSPVSRLLSPTPSPPPLVSHLPSHFCFRLWLFFALTLKFQRLKHWLWPKSNFRCLLFNGTNGLVPTYDNAIHVEVIVPT